MTGLVTPVTPFCTSHLCDSLVKMANHSGIISIRLTGFPRCGRGVISGRLRTRVRVTRSIASVILTLHHGMGVGIHRPLRYVVVPIMSRIRGTRVRTIGTLVVDRIGMGRVGFISNTTNILIGGIGYSFGGLKPGFKGRVGTMTTTMTRVSRRTVTRLRGGNGCAFSLNKTRTIVRSTSIRVFDRSVPK